MTENERITELNPEEKQKKEEEEIQELESLIDLVSLENEDDIRLESLPWKQRQKFIYWLKNNPEKIASLISPYKPFWLFPLASRHYTLDDKRKIVLMPKITEESEQNVDDESDLDLDLDLDSSSLPEADLFASEEEKIEFPPLPNPSELCPVSKLIKNKSLDPSTAYNILDLLFCYIKQMLYYNGDIALDSPIQVLLPFYTISRFLHSKTTGPVYNSVGEVLKSCVENCVEKDKQEREFVRRVVQDWSSMVAEKVYVMIGMGQVWELMKKAKEESGEQKQKGKEAQKRWSESVRVWERKVWFLLCVVNEMEEAECKKLSEQILAFGSLYFEHKP